MRLCKQTDEMKALKKQFWRNTIFLLRTLRLDEYEFALSCNYSGNGFHTAMMQGCLSLDMAFVVCKQLAEPLDDMFFKDYASEWKKKNVKEII